VDAFDPKGPLPPALVWLALPVGPFELSAPKNDVVVLLAVGTPKLVFPGVNDPPDPPSPFVVSPKPVERVPPPLVPPLLLPPLLLPPELLRLVPGSWLSETVWSSHATQGNASANPNSPKTRRIARSIAPARRWAPPAFGR